MPEARPLGAIVLAAGLGTRMRSAEAKVLHRLGGRPLIAWPLAALGGLGMRRTVVVVGHQADAVRRAAEAALPGVETVLQAEQRGTGDAVRCAAGAFAGFGGDVLILYGDVPRISAATLRALVGAHRGAGAALSLLTVGFEDPSGYGRIVRDAAGRVTRIVEERDASPEERRITEINPGFYCVDAACLAPLLAGLRSDNAQGEYYLTDLVALAARAGHRIATVPVERPAEVAGVNTRTELARMEALVKSEQVARWLEAGVTFEDPATAYVGPEVTIGPDTVIGPNVILRGRTRVGAGCRLDGSDYLVDATLGARVHVRFACVLEEAEVGDDAIVGPFARLRPGTRLGARVHVGNFVETKKAVLGAGTKANHLTYLGDCEIGPDTNVGAGTITCNYDGFAKHRTTIGARVQIGSDTQLVAPVTVADDAYVGAGTTVTHDVPAGALAVSRVPMRVVAGWTARRRARAAGSPADEQPKARRGRPPRKPARKRAARRRR
ncbi:MAG TPA: bifunctional UDP-N-acetylglucosamine diphosphorylase/glucosamine-1-phosphate N-acetyltransferase GlmU [Candidatus Binatia bacterium]|nr:bifunctional UDP-N-acetylglucosamine diphosphorylase/glucosamine-1-phosphate N-acetyltransferase GlmU [Candidatus Binatia bacterium]